MLRGSAVASNHEVVRKLAGDDVPGANHKTIHVLGGTSVIPAFGGRDELSVDLSKEKLQRPKQSACDRAFGKIH